MKSIHDANSIKYKLLKYFKKVNSNTTQISQHVKECRIDEGFQQKLSYSSLLTTTTTSLATTVINKIGILRKYVEGMCSLIKS
jgi:hypothetical protein